LQNWTPPTPRKNIPNTGIEGLSYLKKINNPDTKVYPNNKKFGSKGSLQKWGPVNTG